MKKLWGMFGKSVLAPHEADGTMSNGANGNHGADHSDYCEHAPKLKEQLSKKSKHPSAIPGSFYERDLAFKSAAFTERKKVIPPRYKGECEIKQGRFSSWVRSWCVIRSAKLVVYMAPPSSMRHKSQIPNEKELGEPLRKITLVGSHLAGCKNSDKEYTLTESDGSVVHVRCTSTREREEWFVGLAHTPGLFRNAEDYYDIGALQGSGATCHVYECFSKFTGKRYAYKSRIHSNRESTEAMHNELRILQLCAKNPHPAVPKLVDFFFDTTGKIELVMELMKGGDVFEDVLQKSGLPEEKAKVVFKQVASGIAHLHSLGIAHRDIKPENLMYKHPVPADDSGTDYSDVEVKIMDYDLAKVNYCPEWQAATPCGTLHYMAPEVLQGHKYSLSVDSWSLGISLYVLLTGYYPFGGSNDQEVTVSVEKGEFSLQGTKLDAISSEAKDLIQRLLVTNPLERLTPGECLEHPWLQERSSLVQRSSSDSVRIPRKGLEVLPDIIESPQPSGSVLQGESIAGGSSPSRRDKDDLNLSELRVLVDLVGKPAGLADSEEFRKDAGGSSPKGGRPLVHHVVEASNDSFADLDAQHVQDDLDDI